MLNGSSLDEIALLAKAQEEGAAKFKARSAKNITIQIGGGSDLEYEIIATNEFTSERKIMSIVVRESATGKCFTFVKGAESAVIRLLCDESASSTLRTKVEAEIFNFGG